VSFGREKRLLLAWLALLAPLPLPLNEVLAWPVLGLYVVCLAAFLRRAWRDPGTWLPPWAMNLLGALYLPVLYIDLVVYWGGQLVRPVIHLAMFTVVVKLFAMRHERDKWHVLGGCFFLFLAAMGTSVHPSILLYLLAFTALVLTLLTRFSYFSVLSRFGYRQGDLARAPVLGFVAVCLVAVVLVGVPLFAVLPRIRTPYLMMRGTGTGTVVGAAGFSDLITLDSIGSARGDRQVLLRLRYGPQPQPRREIRIKAATYESYDGRSWRASGGVEGLAPDRSGTVRLGSDAPRQQVEMWLLPWNSAQLPLPVQALSLQAPRLLAVGRDRGGAVTLFNRPTATFRYDVELSDQPVFDGLSVPEAGDMADPTLDARGVTPRVAALAARMMGEGTAYHRAQRLEYRLSHDYRYSEDFVGRSGQLPLERFLFDQRKGHCEFFATAMVVMLRSQGIPARFVTGFLGGEPNAFEGYYVVRRSNAHAWVEAYIPDMGWQVFDPTPASGRPGALEEGLGLLMSQVWDYVLFRWDRYVLTFGFYDQLSLFMRARGVWLSVWRMFGRDGDQPFTADTAGEVVTDAETAAAAAASGWREWMPFVMGAVVMVAAIAAGLWLWLRRRQRPTATESYRRLRRRLQGSGVPVPGSLAPLRLLDEARERFPGAAAPASRLVHLYLRESFAEEPLSEEELGEAAESLRAASEVLKKAG
jgi:transglutaminase-like putative cysteine protease